MYIVLEKVPEYRYPLCFEKFKNKSTKFSRPGYPGVLNLVPVGTKFSTPSRFRHADPWTVLSRFADEAVFRASRRPDFEISPDSSINSVDL